MAQPMLSDGGQHKTNSRVFWEDFSQNAPSGLFKNKNKKTLTGLLLIYYGFHLFLWDFSVLMCLEFVSCAFSLALFFFFLFVLSHSGLFLSLIFFRCLFSNEKGCEFEWVRR